MGWWSNASTSVLSTINSVIEFCRDEAYRCMCCGGVTEMKTGKTKICYNSSTRGPLGEISTGTSLISAETDKERNLYEKGKGDQKSFLATSAGLRCQHLANGVHTERRYRGEVRSVTLSSGSMHIEIKALCCEQSAYARPVYGWRSEETRSCSAYHGGMVTCHARLLFRNGSLRHHLTMR